jgi:predicted nucleotidyltransferase
MNPDTISALIRDYCLSRPEIVEVWFHGSRFRGDFRDDSDVDLYFEIDEKLVRDDWDLFKDSDIEYARLNSDLAPLFPHKVHGTYCHTIHYTGGLRPAAMQGALIYRKQGWPPRTPSECSG